MKSSNIDFSRFCILWSIFGAVILSVTLLIMGIKSWGIFFFLMVYGAVIGGLSALIAWKCCPTPHWLRISVGMELSSLFLGGLGYAIITLFSDGWGAMLDLFSITGIYFCCIFLSLVLYHCFSQPCFVYSSLIFSGDYIRQYP